jgi:carbonic anhydrase
MRAHTKETQATMTPAKALQYLREGNERFRQNLKASRDLLRQVNETRDGQFPFATVLSCIDSRTSAELIFDQGLGDVFSVRVAGPVINDDVLGSMEFATKIAGSKLVVVERSVVIRQLIESGQVGLIGGTYSVETGDVTFFDDTWMCGEVKHFYLDVPERSTIAPPALPAE